MNRTCTSLPAARARPSAALRLIDAIDAWWERARQRRMLAELNDAALKDIGVSRADVDVELSKPFWRI